MKKVVMIFAVLLLSLAMLLAACESAVMEESYEGEEMMDDAAEMADEDVDDVMAADDAEVDAEMELDAEVSEEMDSETEVEAEVSGSELRVLMTQQGFEPSTLDLKVGDTLTWEVSRDGRYKQGMVLGTRQHAGIKSAMMQTGDTFTHTFEEAGEYVFVDGIYTTMTFTATVE